METVTRVRMVDTGEVDRGGKPVFSRVVSEHRAFGFAPVVSAEVSGVGEVVSPTGGTLYFRVPDVVDVVADDRFVVRGVEYLVDGPDALWVHPDGVTRGCVVTLKRAEFVNGT